MKDAKKLLVLAQAKFPARAGTSHSFTLAHDGRLQLTVVLPPEVKEPPCTAVYLIEDDELDMTADKAWEEIERLGWCNK